MDFNIGLGDDHSNDKCYLKDKNMHINPRSFLTAALLSGVLLSQINFVHANSCNINDPAAIRSSSYGKTVVGTSASETLNGSIGNDRIFSGGVSLQAESIRGQAGRDRLIFDFNDSVVPNIAGNGVGHIRIYDFIVDNVNNNPEADTISIGRLINQNNLDANNIGNYVHIISGLWGNWRGLVLVNVEGDYTASDRAMLDDLAENNPSSLGGYGTDLMLEFLGKQGDNNFSVLTGQSDNSLEQLQKLIDFGFLELSITDIYGTRNGGTLEGTSLDEQFLIAGVLRDGDIYGNGGSDSLVFRANDVYKPDLARIDGGQVRIFDFTIDDMQTNSEADSLSLGDIIGPNTLTAATAGDYFHFMSGLYGNNRTAVFINLDGDFTAADRQALEANPSAGGNGADLFLEFKGQASDNNLETLTGYVDNSVDQLQTILNWGFLNLTPTGNSTPCN